jgi:hypothetical protein
MHRLETGAPAEGRRFANPNECLGSTDAIASGVEGDAIGSQQSPSSVDRGTGHEQERLVQRRAEPEQLGTRSPPQRPVTAESLFRYGSRRRAPPRHALSVEGTQTLLRAALVVTATGPGYAFPPAQTRSRRRAQPTRCLVEPSRPAVGERAALLRDELPFVADGPQRELQDGKLAQKFESIALMNFPASRRLRCEQNASTFSGERRKRRASTHSFRIPER